MTTKGSDAGTLLSIVARAVAVVLGLTGQPFCSAGSRSALTVSSRCKVDASSLSAV
jgi:hypothetical protein